MSFSLGLIFMYVFLDRRLNVYGSIYIGIKTIRNKREHGAGIVVITVINVNESIDSCCRVSR